jgi:HJR/Mrr/RecB family endonuclease
MERRSRRPSPAMLVAMIALSLTLGGSAIAADTVSKKDVKKIAKKQAKKQIKKLSPRAYALIGRATAC